MLQWAADRQRRLHQWWQARNASTRLLGVYLRRALQRFFVSGNSRAAAIAYYTLFSLFPLVLLSAAALTRLVGPVFAQEQLNFALSAFLPPAASETLSFVLTNVREALDQSSSFTLIAILGLVWSGLGLFAQITLALEHIFDTQGVRTLWRQRVVAVVMALLLLMLLFTSFLTSGLMALLNAFILGTSTIWLRVATFFLPVGISMVMFALVLRYVPARRVMWDAIWPAAIVGAIGWELAKLAFGWYLTNLANYQFVYGTLATGIILLFWAYLLASIFLVSAEICAALNDWLHDRESTSDPDAIIINVWQQLTSRPQPRQPTLPSGAGQASE